MQQLSELWITDEIWQKLYLKKKIPIFIDNSRCWMDENSNLGARNMFCQISRELSKTPRKSMKISAFSTTNLMVYITLQKEILFKRYISKNRTFHK